MIIEKLPFRFKILNLREFSTPMELSGFSVDIGNWNCFAAATKKPIKTRHIAALEVRDWLFKKGVVYAYGTAAESLIEKAKAEGVYFYGDPGQCDQDRKIRKTTQYTPPVRGEYTWPTWASSSSTTTGAFWYTTTSSASTA